MDKIVLQNNTSLEFSSIQGLNVTIEGMTIEVLESLMTKENLTRVQLMNGDGTVYVIYNNLKCTSITRNLKDATISVNLKQLDSLEVKVVELQKTVDALILTNLGV